MDLELKALLREYEQKKLSAEILSDKKKEKIYNTYPQLRKLDESIKFLAISLSKEIVLGNNSSLNTLNQELLNLKNEKQKLLHSLSLSENDFKPDYECKLCNDSGYVVENNNHILCNCLKQKLFNLKYNKANVGNLDAETFNSFNINLYSASINETKYNSSISPRENIQNIKNICLNFVNNFDNPATHNLIFTGNTGLGKTFLSNCIANEILKKDKTVLYQTAPTMFENVINYKFNKPKANQDIYENILNTDLLIIDDLGTEAMNSIKFEELFNIINSRILTRSDHVTKTIISTNLNIKDLFSKYDERIISRFVGHYDICKFFGEDIRWIKKNMK